MMNRTTVSSSNLASVGYDAAQHILEIEFLTGSVYQYFNVPQSVYAGLMAAESHGSYFDANVKKAGYSYKQIR
jgi:hypothetical protein